MKTCIRTGIATARLCDELNRRLAGVVADPVKSGIYINIDSGIQTTIGGKGEIFENFKRSGHLGQFTGCGTKPSGFYDANFEYAKLRYINFDETYAGMPYDCRRSKYFMLNL